MVYKKFIKRGGKTFGPYYYESYRDNNGKVRKKYLGVVNPKKMERGKSSGEKFSFLSYFARHQKVCPLVRVKDITPTKNFALKKVLLIPFVILLVLGLGLMIYSQVDSAIVENSFEGAGDFISGSFFKIAGFVVSDSGESEFSDVSLEEEDSGGGEDEVDESEDVEELVEDLEDSIHEVDEDESEDVEELVDVEQMEELEGEVVGFLEVDSEDLGEEIAEETNETIELNETVELNDTIVEENETFIEEVNETVNLNETSGFNETFVEETNETIELNETVELNNTIIEENETVNLNETLEINGTLEINETGGSNETSDVNETIIEGNETIIEEIVVNETEVAAAIESLTTLQYKAIICRPVKWLKKINVSMVDNLTIEIPKLAENVSVLTDEEIDVAEQEIEDYEVLVGEIEKEEIVSGLLTGNVVKDIYSGKGFFTKLWDWISSFTISGNVVLEEELEADGEIIETEEGKIVDVEKIVKKTDAKKVGVEYYTPAPSVFEKNIPEGKLVTISADDVYNYTDVLAYSLVGGMRIPINNSLKLKVYWRASYEDAVKYGYIEEEVSKKDLKEGEKAPKEKNSDEKEKKEKEVPFVEDVDVSDEAPIGHDSADPGEGLVDEEINESVSDDEKVKDKETKDKENKSVGNEEKVMTNLHGSFSSQKMPKKLLITGEVVKENVVPSKSPKKKDGDDYVRVEVNFSVHDLNGDGFADYVEWIVPHLSNQSYEVSLEILNVQSYPTVGGNWTVRFNTTGEANLTISAFNGTTYGFEYVGGNDDLVFLETRCGDEVLNVSVMINGSVVPYDVYLKKKRIEEIRRLLDG